MILHYSLTILNINANALSLIFFINANTLTTYKYQHVIVAVGLSRANILLDISCRTLAGNKCLLTPPKFNYLNEGLKKSKK